MTPISCLKAYVLYVKHLFLFTFQSPNNIVRYQIVSQTLNSDLFTVNDQTGQVYLRTNVLGNNINQYNVSLALVRVYLSF